MTTDLGRRWFGLPPLFDPAAGRTVIEPPGQGSGWWAGACSGLYDAYSGSFYLYYRLRKPRELGRGVECRIAQSQDGLHFTDIWRATKEEIDTPSMERACLVAMPSGEWRLYLSFVDPDDGRWRIDLLRADGPDGFDPSRREPILTAGQLGVEGVKDPYVLLAGGLVMMIASYAPSPPAPTDAQRREMHATEDVYNTGITRSHTGLAVSGDGLSFAWKGDVLSPGDGWDSYCARIGSLLHTPPVWTAFYDGSDGVDENYEEKTGLAMTLDLTHYDRVTTTGPALVSPHASGSLRYVDAVVAQGEIYYYYEYARPDGSHELRVSVVPLAGE